MKTITASMLKGACANQRALFKATFPDGASVTVASARKARRAGLDVLWLADLLPAPLDAEYLAKRDALDAEYLAKRDALDAEWQAKCDALYAEYLAKRDALDAEWQAKRAPLLVRLLRRA
jgi:hypothetical protein